MFMGAGGWDLTHQWLLDAIMAKNHPLNCEILQLLALCPVNVERLRSNSCPKLVKGLSLESTDESEKLLASNLVMQWMQIVRNEVEIGRDSISGHDVAVVDVPVASKSDSVNTVSVDVVVEASVTTRTSDASGNTLSEIITVEPLQKQNVEQDNIQRVTVVEGEERTDEGGGTSEDSNSPWDAPLPLYKIMIRDGKQVLAKVYSEKRQTPELTAGALPAHHNVSGTVIVNVTPSEEKGGLEHPTETPVIVRPCSITPKDNTEVVKIEGTVETVAEESEEVDSGSEKKVKEIAKDTPAKIEIVKVGRECKKRLKDSRNAVNSPSEKKPKLQESGPSKERIKDKERERAKSKEKVKEEKKKDVKNNIQAEKDKETLAKIMIVSSAVSKTVGKIPKKNRSPEDNNGEVRKVAPAPEVRRTPKPSVSIEVRRSQGSIGEPRPKTVKTFNSKFRSTGLEEEVKPPPPRSATKKNSSSEKSTRLSIPARRPTPPRDIFPPDKKARPGVGIVTDVASSSASVSGPSDDTPRKGEKLVPKSNSLKAKDKPSVAFLQESDVFMDALTAVTRKEPRRRKRRISSSKDDDKVKGKEGEVKKEDLGEGHSTSGTPPHSPDEKSPPVLKPSFKFYQDTLETEEETKKIKEEPSNEEDCKAPVLTPRDEGSPVAESDASDEDSRTRIVKKRSDSEVISKEEVKKKIKKEHEDEESSDSEDTAKKKEILPRGGLKGVLLNHKRLTVRVKKTVKWKEDGELEKVVFFELDETERVNVTKTFMDMKQMERTHEREIFQMARKLAHEDVMEERIPWQPLIPLTLPPSLAEPGSKSREKEVQYAREKVVLQSLYFHRDMIPDTPSEPDLENHPTTDPAIIPLNDVSGNPDSVNDFQSTPWPEPKTMQPPVVAVPPTVGPSGSSVPLIPGIPEHSDPSFMNQHPHQHMVQGHPMVPPGGMAMQYGGMHPSQMGALPLHGGFNNPVMNAPNMTGASMSPVENAMLPRVMNMAGPRPIMHPPNAQQLPMAGMINPGMQPVAGTGGDWRTADGKVVPVEDSQPMVMYNQGGIGPDVGMGGNNAPQMDGDMNAGYDMEYGVQYQEGMEDGPVGGPGYMMPPMGYAGGAGGNVRPPHGGAMYGHPPMFRGSGSRGGRGGPAPARGGPWFRPSGPMPPRGRGGNWEGGRGRGGRGGLRVTVCKHFRAGYCRNGEQCSFLHPGVNGPPVPYMYPE